jgi:hypothetical protein
LDFAQALRGAILPLPPLPGIEADSDSLSEGLALSDAEGLSEEAAAASIFFLMNGGGWAIGNSC